MGFISSAATSTIIELSALLTQKGREYFINDIDSAIISSFSLGDPDTNYMASGNTKPLKTGNVPDITGDYSGCVFSVHCGISDLRNKILRGKTEQFTREVKFKKNEDYINSGDTGWYRNLNVTIHLERMIKYLLLESSEGRQSGSTYDKDIKSPYADFFNEVAVIVSSNTSNLESIERKEMEFKIGEQTGSDREYFKRLFNINQTILDNPAVGIDKYPTSEVDISDYPSPFVLSLSSYLSGNTLSIGGSGKGGVIIYPRSFGYVWHSLQINKPSTATFPIISGGKKFYRETDLENVDFSSLSLFKSSSKIIPAAVVDTVFDGIKAYEARNSILQDPEELLGDDNQGSDEIEKRWHNHYLRFYERGLIIEEIKLLGNFIKNNSDVNNKNRLFDIVYSGDNITPINYLSKKPLVFISKTDDSMDKIGTIRVKFDIDLKSAIDNGQISKINSINDLHNWTGMTSTELTLPFVEYL